MTHLAVCEIVPLAAGALLGASAPHHARVDITVNILVLNVTVQQMTPSSPQAAAYSRCPYTKHLMVNTRRLLATA